MKNPITSDYVPYRPKHLKALLDGKTVLDVGSGDRRLNKHTTTLDIMPFPNVDIVADASDMPLPTGVFDTCWCEAVLEHVKEPEKVVAEMFRVLKPGGYVFAVIPFVHKYHEHPNDYQRYSIPGIEELFKDFKKVEIGVYRGPTSALLSFITEYFTLFTFSKNKRLNFLVKGFAMLNLFWLVYLDKLLCRNPRAHELANALYYIGQKKVIINK